MDVRVMCGGQRTVFRDQFLSFTLLKQDSLVSATLLAGG